jgi:regulator of sigma D
MRRYAFDDHNAPTLKQVSRLMSLMPCRVSYTDMSHTQIMAFCQNAMDFVSRDPDNVISVHCKGGKDMSHVSYVMSLLLS